jgi:signal transduction histidine kinase
MSAPPDRPGSDGDIVGRLAAHRIVGGAPPEELTWLAAHGRLVRYETGAVLTRKGLPVDQLQLVLSGRFAIQMDRGAGSRRIMELRAGDVGGVLPYSRLQTSPVDAFAEEPVETWAIDRRHLQEMARSCPTVTTVLVHEMLHRARAFTANELHDEKMVSLGRLAAGLAHELNNPAAAAVRGASLLGAALGESEQASRALGEAGLGGAEMAAIDRVREICHCAPGLSVQSPLERADREDAIAGWLEGHGVDPAAAASLVDTALSLEALDDLAAALARGALGAAVRWIAAGCAARALAVDVERAASRMHALVSSVKRFTHMDRVAAPEAVDLSQSLADVIAIVAAKARRKSVKVDVNLEPGVPRVLGVPGELNQVWLNLVDNAIDAAPEAGQVVISAARQRGSVVVRVVDDGPGIPPEIQAHIFDAFFTTKPVGEGTGLGLEIVRRLVQGQQGDIEVESRPGRTEFRVTLPAVDAAVPPA